MKRIYTQCEESEHCRWMQTSAASMSQAVRYTFYRFIFMRWCLVLGVFNWYISLWCTRLLVSVHFRINFSHQFWAEQQNTRSYSLKLTRKHTHIQLLCYIFHVLLLLFAIQPFAKKKKKSCALPTFFSTLVYYWFPFFLPLHSSYWVWT